MQLSQFLGKDKKKHRIALVRKAGPGVGNSAKVTGFMPAHKRIFIRERARKTVYEARHRYWFLMLDLFSAKDSLVK